MPKTKKLGRPVLPKGKAKDALVQVRFSDLEKAKLARRAKKEGLKLSEWARQTLIKNAE
jgi:hypothetical protein